MGIEIEHLPFGVDESSWGVPVKAMECCPGVYYLVTKRENQRICSEYYIVLENYSGMIISEETLSYGELSNDAYYFEFERENSGIQLVEFELLRYLTKSGVPSVDGERLSSIAAYATELYPNYFGTYIPPSLTPYGQTIRYKTVVNGIYFVETVHCEWLLAICYPIWESELPAYLQKWGELCKETQAITEKEFNYLFFTVDRCAPVIYEMSMYNAAYKKEFGKFIASEDALVSALWETIPEYVIFHNLIVLTGNGPENFLKQIFSSLGIESAGSEDMEDPLANCAFLNPNVSGKSYLLLP